MCVWAFRKPIVLLVMSSILLTLLSALCHAGESNGTIRAKEILLVDDNGKERAGFKLVNNRPVIFLSDENEDARAFLAETSKGVSLELLDKNHVTRILLNQSDKHGSAITLMGPDRKVRMWLMVLDDDQPRILLKDSHAKPKILIKADDSGAGIGLYESSEQPRLLIQSRDGKGAAISLHDSNKKPKIYLAMMDDRPRFSLEDPQGSGLFSGVAPSGEAYLSLLAQGEPVWVATEASRQAVQQGLAEMDEFGQGFK